MNDAQRDKDATKIKLIWAVESLILDKGFGAIGINAIARCAGVDKVLIYRYFGGLAGLLAAYAEEGDFWWQVDSMLADPLPGPDDEDGLSACLATIFERHVAFLRNHPVTLEVIAWELADRNELTAALESVREERSMAMMRRIARHFSIPEPDLMQQVGPLFALLGAAANYLAARGRRVRLFNGINLHSDAGWTMLCKSVRQMISAAAHPASFGR